jgi:hypothetical protein
VVPNRWNFKMSANTKALKVKRWIPFLFKNRLALEPARLDALVCDGYTQSFTRLPVTLGCSKFSEGGESLRPVDNCEAGLKRPYRQSLTSGDLRRTFRYSNKFGLLSVRKS